MWRRSPDSQGIVRTVYHPGPSLEQSAVLTLHVACAIAVLGLPVESEENVPVAADISGLLVSEGSWFLAPESLDWSGKTGILGTLIEWFPESKCSARWGNTQPWGHEETGRAINSVISHLQFRTSSLQGFVRGTIQDNP